MPDRRRTAFRHPLPERTSMMLRERQSSSPGSPSSSGSSGSSGNSDPGQGPSDASGPSEDNPFAPPPEDRPDQPWQPRHPSHQDDGEGGSDDTSGNGPSGDRPAWGSQWSDRQPGRQNGSFGNRSGGTGGAGGQGGDKGDPKGTPGGLRWDPTDPTQRRARYAVLGGMWAFFFALFDFPEIALLLGALAVYWSVSALRGKPRNPSAADAASPGQNATRATTAQVTGNADAGTPARTPEAGTAAAPRVGQGSKQQTTAAVSGLVTAVLALAIVATTFTVQLVYRDYYTCVNDALTKTGALACNDQLPKPLEPFFGVKK